MNITHRYNTEFDFDGGVLYYSTDGGTTFVLVADNAMLTGSLYSSSGAQCTRRSPCDSATVLDQVKCFTGKSGGFDQEDFVVTTLNLPRSLQTGDRLALKFSFLSDKSSAPVGVNGWVITSITIFGC